MIRAFLLSTEQLKDKTIDPLRNSNKSSFSNTRSNLLAIKLLLSAFARNFRKTVKLLENGSQISLNFPRTAGDCLASTAINDTAVINHDRLAYLKIFRDLLFRSPDAKFLSLRIVICGPLALPSFPPASFFAPLYLCHAIEKERAARVRPERVRSRSKPEGSSGLFITGSETKTTLSLRPFFTGTFIVQRRRAARFLAV